MKNDSVSQILCQKSDTTELLQSNYLLQSKKMYFSIFLAKVLSNENPHSAENHSEKKMSNLLVSYIFFQSFNNFSLIGIKIEEQTNS